MMTLEILNVVPNLGTLIGLGGLVFTGIGMVGGYFMFKGSSTEKHKNLNSRLVEVVEDVESVEAELKELSAELQEVKSTANTTKDYAEKSEADRKKVMEEFMPMLTHNLGTLSGQMATVLEKIEEIKIESTTREIYKAKFFQANPDLIDPDKG